MDQRRFLTWLMLTSALFFLYMSVQRPVAPKPLPNDVPVAENADPLLQDSPLPKVDPAAPVAEIGAPQQVMPLNPGKVVTLGSMDPTKKFKMLVTLSTRGAGLIRAEMVDQKDNGALKRSEERRVGKECA